MYQCFKTILYESGELVDGECTADVNLGENLMLIEFSETSIPAVYWVSMRPANMPAPFVRKAGSPILRFGLSSLFVLLSDRAAKVVTAVPRNSRPKARGVP